MTQVAQQALRLIHRIHKVTFLPAQTKSRLLLSTRSCKHNELRNPQRLGNQRVLYKYGLMSNLWKSNSSFAQTSNYGN